ncbi:MAG: hypothetical protein ACRC1I_01710 [Pseudomonas proteolytica]|uniref:hypothetical protein n=1 Tax=Pseudomonas proteolytica TaxID=219574 RepID=UPI003F3D4FFC
MLKGDGKVRISHFKITCSGGKSFTNELYANGRHQCEVAIEVRKEVLDENNVWHRADLTPFECSSLSIVDVVAGSMQALPNGWYCDKQRNSYTLGLWCHDDPQQDEVKKTEAREEHFQVIRFYLRYDPVGQIEPAAFMARINVEKEYLTTDFSLEVSSGQSIITLDPVTPLRLNASQFVRYVHYGAYSGNQVSVTVFYWMPPGDLNIVESKGLSDPLDVPLEGHNFQTSQLYRPSGSVGGTKVGVVLNKDVIGRRLYMNDVSRGLDLPEPNPEVKFNEYPTIVRAVRVYSPQPISSADTKSPWTLVDEYGNPHQFILRVDSLGGVNLEEYRESIVTDFKIILPGDLPSSNALYANGRHQCKVIIEAIKQERQEDDTWKAVPFSQAELDSATVTLYSANDGQELPSGWYCDTVKNIYDTGLWVRGSENSAPEELINEEYVRGAPLAETIDRYMRVDANIPIEPLRFMARIRVGGKWYTSYHSNGGKYVTITATRPYAVKAAELTLVADTNAYNDSVADCDVYYWMLPSGLRFVANKGLDRPLSMRNEGDHFTTSWSTYQTYYKEYCKAGVLVTKDDPELRIRMSDIHRRIYDGSDGENPFIPFNKHNTMMRAIRLKVPRSTPFTMGDAMTPWRLWDNYGCEQVYRLDFGREGLDIILKDY